MGETRIITRIMKELKDVEKSPPPFCSAGMAGSNIRRWQATIIGPPKTPYEGGVFNLSIAFPPGYPIKPPVVTFNTKIYHPNIDRNGNICLNILKDNWTPAYTVSAVLVSVCSLLSSPNPDDPLEPAIAAVFKKNEGEYQIQAREWTQKFAMM
ncbi:ubiquitin-conjugating enzyme E2 11-like [Alnus glutinosa]|jgi:ubiquitin-conjugating enzyme E2 D/E|uniref:ubiquitin-conjugating enzyme E2 11-like n=1 Tax=Alnus glutinosa TaxID=3517 RepID=UPI002D794A2C|nr:ubiquitin-conjugating enzyme E2 11-like [Alnus glutinosa]